MHSTKSKVGRVILVIILVGIGATYLALTKIYFPQNTLQTTSPVVGLGVTTTSAPINSNSFTTAGQTYLSPTAPGSSSPNSSESNFSSGTTMTFDGEFNTFNRYVDQAGNVTCNPGGTGIWQTVYYFCSRTSAGNKEAEVYTDPSFWAYLLNEPLSTAEADSNSNPFSVSNGVLSIAAAPSSQQVLKAVGSWAQYSSGMITTQFSFSQEYGYFEIRAKLPAGRGLWPAFWLLPEDKTWPPEIDALEAFGDTSAAGQGGLTMIHYGSHALTSGENCGGWYNVHTNITAGFHTYGVDWEPTGITYFFDGEPYATCPANSAADKPMYMVVNLAVGGPGSWPGIPGASSTWPAYLYVSYVRAYQKNSRL